MLNLRFASITEIDENSNLKKLAKVARQYPFCELGVSLNNAKCSQDIKFVTKFGELMREGQVASMLELSHEDAVDLLKGNKELIDVSSLFGRIRLNIESNGDKISSDYSVDDFKKASTDFIYGFGQGRIIIPYSYGNTTLCSSASSTQFIEVSTTINAPNDEEVTPKLPMSRIGFTDINPIDNNVLEQDMYVIRDQVGSKPFWIEIKSSLLMKYQGSVIDLKLMEEALQNVSMKLMSSSIVSGEKLVSTERQSQQSADQIDGYWANWWSALAGGYRVSLPDGELPSSPVHFDRRTSSFSTINPLEYSHDAMNVLEGSDIEVIQKDGVWHGVTQRGIQIPGEYRELAMVRAFVADKLGMDLPANPANHPAFQNMLVGVKMTQDLLPKLSTDQHNAKKFRRFK